MTFRINDGPFAGQEGDKVQSRVIRDRLLKEARAQRRHPRHRAVRQQGRLRGGRPRRTAARHPDRDHAPRRLRAHRFAPARACSRSTRSRGQRLEPIEEVIIDVDEEHSGVVVQKLSERRGELSEMRPSGGGRQRLVFHVPTRGLIGYQGELLTDTRGTAVMNRLFHDYAPFKGEIAGRRTGVLISNATGEATAYSLFYLQDRGAMMIDPQTRVYEGMIVGEHTRDNDLDVNVIQGKKLTNVRASGKDENVILTPPMRLTLERALSYIARRRAGRGDAQVDPPAQALARPQRAQAPRAASARPRKRRFDILGSCLRRSGNSSRRDTRGPGTRKR